MPPYTMRAYPTVFNGRRYRSRLEAKWAAFFHILGWRAEYEPLDVGSWSPDFLLKSNTNTPDVLVEVKPITCLDASTCLKMERATSSMDHRPELLLLGLSPWRPEKFIGSISIGWSKLFTGDPEMGGMSGCSWFERNADALDLGRGLGSAGFPSMEIWSEACNLVQWNASA